MKNSKILMPLHNIMEQYKRDQIEDPIEVSIMLRYDLEITKASFLATKFSSYKKVITDPEGLGGYNFFAKLTIEEIEKISTWDEITTISIPTDTLTLY
ncbi:hypothetical protein ABDI30_04020 [Paenibacillus cisolokensis]|uniref:hypothetical protein n=1 Tax=Paenibacillus cisolokensis TaxID=1658519 RepID=UPI003D2CB47D